MTYNENIIIFYDISCHLKLEDECLKTSKTAEEAFVIDSSKVVILLPRRRKVPILKLKRSGSTIKQMVESTNLRSVQTIKRKSNALTARRRDTSLRNAPSRRRIVLYPFFQILFLLVAFFLLNLTLSGLLILV